MVAEGLQGGAHGLVGVEHKGVRVTGGGKPYVGIGAEDAAEELHAGDNVIVEAALKDGFSGEPSDGEAEGGEELELGPEDLVWVDEQQFRGLADQTGDLGVGETVAAEKSEDRVGLGLPDDADPAGGHGCGGGGGEAAGGDEVRSGGGVGKFWIRGKRCARGCGSGEVAMREAGRVRLGLERICAATSHRCCAADEDDEPAAAG